MQLRINWSILPSNGLNMINSAHMHKDYMIRGCAPASFGQQLHPKCGTDDIPIKILLVIDPTLQKNCLKMKMMTRLLLMNLALMMYIMYLPLTRSATTLIPLCLTPWKK